jgi:hypothetical protein
MKKLVYMEYGARNTRYTVLLSLTNLDNNSQTPSNAAQKREYK